MIYTNVTQKFNKIFFRGYKDGRRISKKLDYSPKLYVKTSDKNEIYKSLFKDPLEQRTFASIGEAKNFVKENSEFLAIHGNTKYEYAFIHDYFKGDQSVSLSDITVHSIDIETAVEHGLTIPEMLQNPLEEILLISVIDYNTKELTTFGARESDVPNYIKCDSEEDLLRKYIRFVQDKDPDIITGWNSNGFDVSYICSRIIRVLGEKEMNSLSPFNMVERTVENYEGRISILYDIVGRSTLDLLELYKKFRYINRESYKLDFIAFVELGKNKLKSKYSTFKEQYDLDWNGFVRYNQEDTRLVDELEQKLGLVYLATQMAYIAKINYSDVYSPIKTWEQYIHWYLKDQNIFCGIKSHFSSPDHRIAGGYVKEPVPNLYKWIVSFDFTSLYPKIIESLNMSPETIHTMVDCTIKKLLDGYKHTDPLTTLAANGATFLKDKDGIMPHLTSILFAKRKEAKDKMKEHKKKYEKTKDLFDKAESDRYNVIQLATKVNLNSLFGACASPYFMFFDNRIAEGITMTGQVIIQYVSDKINKYLQTISGTTRDLVLMTDTDSAFFNFGPLVEKYAKGKSDEEICKFINEVINKKIRSIIDEAVAEFIKNTNAISGHFDFKLEKIASIGFITGKKRYAMKVLENEGIKYDEPDIAITGIEVVRSSTPQLVRDWILDGIKIILDEDQEKLLKFVETKREEFNKKEPEQIAFPRSANNLEQYSDRQKIYKKATPIGVRASLLFNHYINENNLKAKYGLIGEGDKMKFIYLKKPNTIREDVIAFNAELPKELNLHKYVDYDKQFEKVFLDPVQNITNAIGWKVEDTADLEGFF